MRHALLIIDVQNDFCPDGALPVSEGDQVVPVLNRWAERFGSAGWPVYASRDWHPNETKHFESFGGPWPPHCVAGTKGAEFHSDLQLPDTTVVVSKGMNPEEDAYSAFQAFDDEGVSIKDLLRRHQVQSIFVGGLATDYCVKQTVLDGLREGFQMFLILEAMRGVEVSPGDSSRAIKEMVRKGAGIAQFDELTFGMDGMGVRH
jgi:nicotinamidase/pyrazinamidase